MQLFKKTIYAAVAILPICLATLGASPMQSSVQGRLNPQIGAAAPRRYANVRDAKDWKNPYLVIGADGIEVTSKEIASGKIIIEAAELEQTLLGLPVAAWLYGRVIAVQESGVRAPADSDDPSVAQHLVAAIAILKKLDVAVVRWPGA